MKEHFAKLLGNDRALDNPNELMAYSYDGLGREGKARVVLFPKTDDEVQKIVNYANRINMPIITRGLGTNPLGMVVPDNAIVMDMGRFDRVHTINLKDGWVHVDCGVVLADLQRQLEQHGWRFPILPQTKNTATIGALLAMDQMDQTSYKYGRLSKHVLEIELIDGAGKHYPQGNKSFIGLEGVGAVLLRAKIAIRKLPETTTSDHLVFDKAFDLLAAMEEKENDLTVSAIEYINPVLASYLGMQKRHHLLIQYESNHGEIRNEGEERIWAKREQCWSQAAKHERPFIEDCFVERERIYDLLDYCEKNSIPLAGHIALGILHPFFGREGREDYYDFIQGIGKAVGQFGYGELKRRFVPDKIKSQVKRLKDEYDYNDILGRGKLYDYA